MATKSKFTLQPYKDTGTLTGSNAPQTRSTSYQTTAPEMVARKQAFNKFLSGAGNLGATISGTPKSKASDSSGNYSDLFVGGQGTAVGSQTPSGKKTTAAISTEAVAPSAPLAPVAPAGGESASADGGIAGSSGGNVGAGAGGYSPPGFSEMDEIDTGTPSPQTVQAGTTGETRYLPDGTPINAGDSRYSTASAQQPTGTTKSKYEQGFNAANTALGGQAPPKGQALATVQSYSPGKSNDTASTYVQTDPFIDGLVKAWQDYINPTNQRKSLADTYSQMIKDSGVQALDTELLDMKNVIEGSEDDLRNEITKAGGFATESQIQGLTNARNKQLIKNYDNIFLFNHPDFY